MAERFELPARPLQFRSGDSLVHRLGPMWKGVAAAAVGGTALAVDDLRVLVGLAALVSSGYFLARLPLADLWKDVRWLLLQGALVVALTLVVKGAGSLAIGLRTALQILLIFLPAALVMRTTPTGALLEGLRAWLPERIAFGLGATLRFLPVFARELAELIEMQRLRGARLSARDLWRRAAWRDWLACVAVPMTVRAIEIAEEAADAAAIRGIGAVEGEEFP